MIYIMCTFDLINKFLLLHCIIFYNFLSCTICILYFHAVHFTCTVESLKVLGANFHGLLVICLFLGISFC